MQKRAEKQKGIQMNSVKILASGMYLPRQKIENEILNKKFNLEDNWIYKRTGIRTRYWAEEESTLDLAIKAVENLKEKSKLDLNKVGLIVVASTNFENTMPGISFEIQKYLNIQNCMCMDLLAGCCGYINGIDIARKYLEVEEVEQALVIGVEKLSKYLDKNDINTAILLGDGAGATLLAKSANKQYAQNIQSIGQDGDILTCKENKPIWMDGKKVYKFAIEKVTKNIIDLLQKENLNMSDITYIIPHQSNKRILENVAEKIGAKPEQMYSNIERVGNTFNASIPIALNEILDKKLLKKNEKILLAGYGGGLNLGSILIEI